MTSDTKKSCSICGKSHPVSEFSYGNREERSYCQACNEADQAARAKGGAEAARKFKEEQQAKWKS